MTAIDAETQPLVRCDDLTVMYGHDDAASTVISGVSCAVVSGDRIALIGPSGSGKSSLLHVIAGLVAPRSGSVEWPGLDAKSGPGQHGVAVAFQAPSLVSALSVVENVELPLELSARDGHDANEAARATLDSLDLAHLANKLPHELSGGQAQRVALARALASSPRLLLADEPTGQIDHGTARPLLDAMFAYAQSHDIGLVIATHDPEVAARCSTRWRIQHGALLEEAEQ